jgi:hypothetical protein
MKLPFVPERHDHCNTNLFTLLRDVTGVRCQHHAQQKLHRQTALSRLLLQTAVHASQLPCKWFR